MLFYFSHHAAAYSLLSGFGNFLLFCHGWSLSLDFVFGFSVSCCFCLFHTYPQLPSFQYTADPTDFFLPSTPARPHLITSSNTVYLLHHYSSSLPSLLLMYCCFPVPPNAQFISATTGVMF